MSMNGGKRGKDGGEESTMSPLVTAQDRKRMILERRRKEREQQTVEETSFSNVAFASNTTTASCSAFGSLKLKRRRSDATSSLLASSNENTTPKAGKSTLFGAVMQRTSSGSTNASTPTKQSSRSNAAAMSSSTPLQNRSLLSDNNVTTPSSSRNKSFLSANSPCGFALLKVLESVASPFRHKDTQDEADNEEEESTVHTDTRIEEWQEGFLHEDSIGVLDWSMKRKVRLECHPGSCLPNMTDWQQALAYWQHPAMYPLPNFNNVETTEVSSQSSTSKVSASMHPSHHLSDMVRGRDALIHLLARHDVRVWKQRRNREWQEAFRSLWFQWMKQVEALQQALESGGDNVSAQSVAQTYFYAMAPGQTVLFRVGTEPSDVEEKSEKPRLVPIVVLSSTTLNLRSKLRSMGAKLVYYHDKKVEFEEAVLERKKPAKAVTEDETETVQQELEALRRAQAHGETAGADVSIATKTKTTTKSPRSVPPLCLVGDDDCFAFFEYYLNTMGGQSTWLKCNGDVPLLLSRKVGPFMHASMQSLSITSRREVNDSQVKATDHHAAIELRGTILPCAMEELVCAAASRMMQDTTVKGHSANGEDDVGSHYFVVQAQAHDGEERPSSDGATTGTAGSRWLNDGSDMYSMLAPTKDGPTECDHGEVLSMLVWDIARPNMIAYKTKRKIA